MVNPEKKRKGKSKADDKEIGEHMMENQSMDTSLGDELLDREIRRSEAARKLVSKYKSDEEEK